MTGGTRVGRGGARAKPGGYRGTGAAKAMANKYANGSQTSSRHEGTPGSRHSPVDEGHAMARKYRVKPAAPKRVPNAGNTPARGAHGNPPRGGRPQQNHSGGRGGRRSGGTTPTPPGTQGATTKPAATAPFLTASQQLAENRYDANNADAVNAQQRRMTDANYNTKQAMAQYAKQNLIGRSNTNDSMAARGLFQSSIRDGDLNDLDATMAMRNNIAETRLRTLMADANNTIMRLHTDYANTHNFYNQEAVQNAQNQAPDTGGPGGSNAGGTGQGTGSGGAPTTNAPGTPGGAPSGGWGNSAAGGYTGNTGSTDTTRPQSWQGTGNRRTGGTRPGGGHASGGGGGRPRGAPGGGYGMGSGGRGIRNRVSGGRRPGGRGGRGPSAAQGQRMARM